MNISEKTKRMKSKKAFTLVELVIVIAILSILAAIAIPVITTTLNATKVSTLESNSATVEMLLKEAINTSKAEIKNIKYNSVDVTSATVKDVLIQNNIDTNVMNVQRIGGVDYAISWDNVIEGVVLISGSGISGYNLSTKICSLS